MESKKRGIGPRDVLDMVEAEALIDELSDVSCDDMESWNKTHEFNVL